MNHAFTCPCSGKSGWKEGKSRDLESSSDSDSSVDADEDVESDSDLDDVPLQNLFIQDVGTKNEGDYLFEDSK